MTNLTISQHTGWTRKQDHFRSLYSCIWWGRKA